MSETKFSEESLRKIAEQKVNFRRSLKIHFFLYIIVNAMLIGLDFIFTPFIVDGTLVPENLWVIYPILGWGIGVVMHLVSYLLYAKGVFPMAKRGLIYHVIAYMMVLLLLTFSNLITMPEYLWVLWPAIFWGIGVIAHIAVYKIYYTAGVTETGVKSKKEKAIEKEMEKMRKKVGK